MSNLNRQKDKKPVRINKWRFFLLAVSLVFIQALFLCFSDVQMTHSTPIRSAPTLVATNSAKNSQKTQNLNRNETIGWRLPFNSTLATTASNHSEVSHINQVPLFVLHVGPPKTGTTSLQYMLKAYEKILLNDSYHYVGNAKIMGGFFTRCMKKMERKNHTKPDELCWENFIGVLEFHRKLGHNIILSNEVIGFHALRPFTWKLIHGYLGRWSRVQIVVSYRHLHNFIPSAHFELQKNQRWPGPPEYGKFVTPFTMFWNNSCNHSFVGPVPTPRAVMARFSAHYKVKILNVESHDQVSDFLCKILDRAYDTCAYHRTNSSIVKPPDLNQRDDGQLNYDSLALEAWRNNLLKNEQTRSYLRTKIKNFQEIQLGLTPSDFPLDCLDQHEEARLLEESLQHARDCGLDLDIETGKSIQSSFFKAKGTNKFCTINATLAFANETWQKFFADAKTVW